MGKRLLSLTLFLFYLMMHSQGQGTAGRDFWVAFPDPDFNCFTADSKTFRGKDSNILFITSAYAAKVRIEMKKETFFSSGLEFDWSRNIILTANQVYQLRLPVGISCRTLFSDNITNNGVHVTSDSLITVVALTSYSIAKSSTSVMPTTSIPEAPEYIVTTNQPSLPFGCMDGQKQSRSSAFLIVGISDESKIEIVCKGISVVRNNTPGLPFIIYLKKGQTFYFITADNDLTGSIIRARNKSTKFAVFSASRRTESAQLNSSNIVCKGGEDLIFEQLQPTITLGTSYTALPFRNNPAGYYLKIASVEDHTRISIDGKYVKTLQQGHYMVYNVNSDTLTQVTSDKHITIAQFAKGTGCNLFPSPKLTFGDVSEVMLVPDVQPGYSSGQSNNVCPLYSTWPRGKPTTPENYLNVLIPSADTGQFMLNGAPVPGIVWKSSYVKKNYLYAQIPLDSVMNYNMTSPNGVIAYMYGYRTKESYAYVASARSKSIRNNFIFDNHCIYDTVVFMPIKNDSFSNYSWDLDDKLPIKTGEIVKTCYNDTGWVRIAMYCRHVRTNAIDSVVKNIYIAIAGRAKGPVLINDTMVCGIVNFALFPKDFHLDNHYQWEDDHPNYYRSIRDDGLYWLEVTERNGCHYRDTLKVTNFKFPRANFLFSDTAFCFSQNRKIIFTNISYAEDTIVSNTWDFGQSAVLNNDTVIEKLYTKPGQYMVRLKVRTNHDCEHDTFRLIEIWKSPKAIFSIKDVDSCLNSNKVTFVNETVKDSINHKWFNWFFSEGYFISNSNPGAPRSYTSPGVYTASLVYEYQNGCIDTMEKSITIYPHPKSAFKFNNGFGCLNDTIKMSNQTISQHLPIKRQWYFGDGSSDTSLNPVHVYTIKGAYPVKLISESPQGCKDSITSVLKVYSSPTTSFTINDTQQCMMGNSFSLTNTSKTDTGIIMSAIWRYSDSTQTLETDKTSKTFTRPGLYRIRLRVVNLFGCIDSLEKIVEVRKDPNAAFGINDASQCYLGHGFNLSYTPLPGNDTITGMRWYYGTDSQLNISTINNLRFPSDGMYPIRLKVFSAYGCSGEASRTVFVNPHPQSMISTLMPVQCFKGHAFDFTDMSTIASGNIASYEWDFADMTKSYVQHPAGKTYPAPGNYAIRLITNSDSGCADTGYSKVEINPNAVLNIPVVPDVCLNDSSYFAANAKISGGTIKAWFWDFGDNENSPDSSTAHVYKQPGSYTIMLRTISDKNCRDSLFASNWARVHALPVPDFTYSVEEGDKNNTLVSFVNTTSPNPVSLFWDFGSFGKSLRDTSLSILDTSTIRARLFVVDMNGCKGLTQKYIFASAPALMFFPNAFTPNSDNLNDGFGPKGVLFAHEYGFRIYNRWGEIVFSSAKPGETWDGTYQGEHCPDGVYTYYIELKDFNGRFKKYRGTVTLLR